MPLFVRSRLQAKVRRGIDPSHRGSWSARPYGAEVFRCQACGGAAFISPETGDGRVEDMLRLTCELASATRKAYNDVILEDRAALILIHTENLVGGQIGGFRDLMRMVATDGGEGLSALDRADRLRVEMHERFTPADYPAALTTWAACYGEEYEEEADAAFIDDLLSLPSLNDDERRRFQVVKSAQEGGFEREGLGVGQLGPSGYGTSIILATPWMAARGFPYLIAITGPDMVLPEFAGFADYQSAEEAARVYRNRGYDPAFVPTD